MKAESGHQASDLQLNLRLIGRRDDDCGRSAALVNKLNKFYDDDLKLLETSSNNRNLNYGCSIATCATTSLAVLRRAQSRLCIANDGIIMNGHGIGILVNNVYNNGNNNSSSSNNDNQNSNNKLHVKGRAMRASARCKKRNEDGSAASCPRFPLTRLRLTFHLLALALIILAHKSSVVESIDCFICQSRNGSNPACDDPFHNIYSVRITTPALPDNKPNVSYHTPCYTARKGRDGLFPASACLKLSGRFENGETIVVRHCGLDSGTLTQDTEIVRMSHCGNFLLDGSTLKGCVMACAEDACNSSQGLLAPPMALLLLVTGLVATLVHHRSG